MESTTENIKDKSSNISYEIVQGRKNVIRKSDNIHVGKQRAKSVVQNQLFQNWIIYLL